MEANAFDIRGRVAVVTGGGGVLGGSIARYLARQGARVVLVDIRKENLDTARTAISEAGGEVLAFEGNVLEPEGLAGIRSRILEQWKRIDILVNAAGGNLPGATLRDDQDFFDLRPEDFSRVNDLNLDGTVIPCQVFGKPMADQGSGAVVNVSSMATYSAITRVPGYSTAKSGINIFTQWLASEMALKFGEGVRVNAIAPGFFIGDQNRAVLLEEDGSLTERSRKILARTPMKRFGDIGELNGAVQFLCSDAARFITGAILPVDGGFSAFSGV
ncbi:MAG: SDR family oxidoreductase [Bacteroidales bacterium]